MGKDIPYGYCHCGCGEKTNIMPWNDKGSGLVKGEPYRYIAGHTGRLLVKNTPEIFWGKVDKRGALDCWEWLGAKSKTKNFPYGVIMYKGKKTMAHRLSWTLSHGDIPEGMFVLHKCDNPACCNPAHLFLGTHNDNMADMATKKRVKNRRGKKLKGILPDGTVAVLRQMHSNGKSILGLSKQYGIARTTMTRLLRDDGWVR